MMTPTVTDSSLFFLRMEDILIGMSATYVDDFLRAGTSDFIRLSKATRDKFQSKKPSFTMIKFAGLEIDTS